MNLRLMSKSIYQKKTKANVFAFPFWLVMIFYQIEKCKDVYYAQLRNYSYHILLSLFKEHHHQVMKERWRNDEEMHYVMVNDQLNNNNKNCIHTHKRCMKESVALWRWWDMIINRWKKWIYIFCVILLYIVRNNYTKLKTYRIINYRVI